MLNAIVREVSPTIQQCQLTFIPRQPIDVERAIRQHRAYKQCLTAFGLRIISLPVSPELPDAVFVQDTSVVVDEVAVAVTMGAVNRRPEVSSVADVLKTFRPLKQINQAGTLEGGDVVRIGRTLYVGLSKRTNLEGINQLSKILKPFGYQVKPVQVKSCLHLSTACSYLGLNTIVANKAWMDISAFDGFDLIDVDPGEPWAANVMVMKETIILPASYPRTSRLVQSRGFKVQTIDVSELEKAEAGLTCMSIIFDSEAPPQKPDHQY